MNYPKCFHEEMFAPEDFEKAIRKQFGQKDLEIDLEPITRRGKPYGTKGHITNPATGSCVLIISDQQSGGRLQIEYRYAVDKRDFTRQGVVRFGSSPESIAPEIARMLKEKDEKRVLFELNFGRKQYA